MTTWNEIDISLRKCSFFRDTLKPLFYTRIRLGHFHPEDMNPYNKINSSVIQSAEHRELAIKATMKSFVLMKNDKNVLPLKSKVENLAVKHLVETIMLKTY